MTFPYPRDFILSVLAEAPKQPELWTVQGFGFIRRYFAADKRWRLNVWHNELRTNASSIHDHPWGFTSYVYAGELRNVRYTENVELGSWHTWAVLRPGMEGGLYREAGGCAALLADPMEVYAPGQTYRQHRREIHETFYANGTVTLNDRAVPPGGQDLARIFWPVGEEWRDAMPRPATQQEIEVAVSAALENLQ